MVRAATTRRPRSVLATAIGSNSKLRRSGCSQRASSAPSRARRVRSPAMVRLLPVAKTVAVIGVSTFLLMPSTRMLSFCWVSAWQRKTLCSSVLDQVVVVGRRLRVGIVEVEPTGSLPAVTRQQHVDESVERRQPGALADLQSRDGDVARRVPVELDAGPAAVEVEPAVGLGPTRDADNTQPAARDRDLLVGAVRLAAQLFGPRFQLGAFLVDAVVKVDGANVGILEHVADPVAVAGGDRGDRVGVVAPGGRIVRARVASGVARLARRFGPLFLAALGCAPLPWPNDPALLFGQWDKRGRQVREVGVVGARLRGHGRLPPSR